MQGSHAWRGDSAVFDEDNLVSHAGLVPLLELAEQAGLSRLLDEHVRFASERVKSGAANSTPKLTSIVAGMAAGADSIDDLDVIRSGGMKKLFGGVYACATLGIFLREFTHGHVRQLSAVLRRHPGRPGRADPAAGRHRPSAPSSTSTRCCVRCTGTPSRAPRSATRRSPGRPSCGGACRRWRSRSAPTTAAPVVAGVRLRAGRAGSAKGAASMVTEAINTAMSRRRAAAEHPGARRLGLLRRQGHRRGRQGRGHGSPSPSPATPPSTPRSTASPTSVHARCTTPARSPIPTPVN